MKNYIISILLAFLFLTGSCVSKGVYNKAIQLERNLYAEKLDSLKRSFDTNLSTCLEEKEKITEKQKELNKEIELLTLNNKSLKDNFKQTNSIIKQLEDSLVIEKQKTKTTERENIIIQTQIQTIAATKTDTIIKEDSIFIKYTTELSFPSVFFDLGSHTIEEKYADLIEQVGKIMEKDGSDSTMLILKGHASEDGNENDNLNLSENRNQQIINRLNSDYKINKPIQRIKSEAFGSRKATENRDNENRAWAFRKVDMKIKISNLIFYKKNE